jgi:hypothetical protein
MAREWLDQIHRSALEKTFMDGGTAADATVPLYIWADRATPASALAALAEVATLDPKPAKGAKAGKGPKPSDVADKDDPPPPEEPEDPPPPNLTKKEKAERAEAIQAAKDAGIIGQTGGKRPPPFLVRLLVTSMDNATPLSADVGAKLPASEPESTKYVVDLLKSSIGSCDAIMTTLGTAGLAGTPDKEAAKLVAEIPAGLLKCQCNVASVPNLELGMRQWFGAWAPSLQWIDLPKVTAKDKRPISKLVK